jgi:hypothetical protein
MYDNWFFLLYNMRGLGQQPAELYKSSSLSEVVRWGQDFQRQRWEKHGVRIEDWELTVRFGYGPQTMDFGQAKMLAAVQLEQSRQAIARAMYSATQKAQAEGDKSRGSGKRARPRGFTGIW